MLRSAQHDKRRAQNDNVRQFFISLLDGWKDPAMMPICHAIKVHPQQARRDFREGVTLFLTASPRYITEVESPVNRMPGRAAFPGARAPGEKALTPPRCAGHSSPARRERGRG